MTSRPLSPSVDEACPRARVLERGLARAAIAVGAIVSVSGVLGLRLSGTAARNWGLPIGSAGAFALAGIALVAATREWRLVARAAAVGALLVAALSVPETMSASAAVSFTLLALGLLALARRCPSRHCLSVASGVALVSITHCALTLAAHALGIPVAFGWALYARMASGTAWLMCLLGVGVLLSAFRYSRAAGLAWRRWLPAMATGGMVGATLVLWQVIQEHDTRATAREVNDHAQSMAAEIQLRTVDRARLLDRLANRWANEATPGQAGWDVSVREWVRDYPGMAGLSWMDTSATVRMAWQSRPFAIDSLGARLSEASAVAPAIERARATGETQASTAVRADWQDAQVLLVAPIRHHGRVTGFLTSGLELAPFFDGALGDDVARGYGFTLRDGATVLYEERPPLSRSAMRWHVTVPVGAMGRPWTLTVWPRDDVLAATASRVPAVVLVVGLVWSAVMGWVVLAAQRSRDLSGQLAELVGELAAENAARRGSEQLRAALVHSTMDGVAAFDAAGCVSMWNPRMAALTGRSELEVDGAMIGSLIPFLAPGAEVQMLLDALAGRDTQLPDVRTADAASGAAIWLEVSVTPLRSSEGHTLGGLLVARDITERKRVADLVLAGKVAAEEANRAKSEFLARMSHELRTPLNAVIGFTNVLRRNGAGRLTREEITYLERINSNGRHLLGLINEVLDLAKIESGRESAALAPVSVTALVRDTIAELDVRASGASVQLCANLPATAAETETDAAKLKQVLINLIGNAIKFTPAAGRVTVTVTAEPSTGAPSRIDVADTGIGIPAARLEAIFEAFEQVDSDTARRFGGTGLGLAISRQLCQLLGYRLEVSSEEGRGSTFSVVLANAQPAQAAA